MKEAAPQLNVSSSDQEDEKDEPRPDGENDPDFNQVKLPWECFAWFSSCPVAGFSSCPFV